MLHRLLQSISNKPILVQILKILGWILILTAIVIANVIMKDQEISYVYNNF